MSRYASWFSTKSGRNFTHWSVGIVAASVFGSQIATHGPFLDSLKEIFQIYNKDQPRPLPPKLNSLIEQVLQESNLKEEEKKKLKFFLSVGHEPFHAGGLDSPWGGIIGLPFFFEDMKTINLKDIKMIGKDTIDWVIDGSDFIRAVTITDNAKKFAILREIYSCKFSDVLTNAVIGAGCVLFPANLAKNINSRLNAFERLSLGQRCTRYLLFYSIGFLFYRLLKDPLKHISQKTADKLAAEAGIDYLDGGIEYYQKTLMKNIALRELSNSKFKSPYDEHGNENYFLFAQKLPISKRLDYLQNLKKEKMGSVKQDV